MTSTGIDQLAPNEVLVFPSTRHGHHTRGAALYARMYLGAKYGIGEGSVGQTYAIPTKDEVMQPIPATDIRESMARFFAHAKDHAEKIFLVSNIDLGFVGVAGLFTDAPENVRVPKGLL